jgi:hypothetical protein
MGSVAAATRFPSLRPTVEELVVVDGEGGVYEGPDAFIMALWGLCDFQDWAERLAQPMLRPLARRAFSLLSSQRRRLSRWLIAQDNEVLSHGLLAETDPARCSDGACQSPAEKKAASPRVEVSVTCHACGHRFPSGREFCPACLSAIPDGSCVEAARTAG